MGTSPFLPALVNNKMLCIFDTSVFLKYNLTVKCTFGTLSQCVAYQIRDTHGTL